MEKNNILCGLYTNKMMAYQALRALRSAGYTSREISMLKSRRHGDHNFVYEMKTNLRFGSFLGALLGILLFGSLLLLTPLKIEPPNGVVEAATKNQFTVIWIPLLTLFAGGLLGAACGALVGIGTPVDAAHRFHFYLEEGGILLTVSLPANNANQEQLARNILERTNAQDISLMKESDVIEKISDPVQKHKWLRFRTRVWNH